MCNSALAAALPASARRRGLTGVNAGRCAGRIVDRLPRYPPVHRLSTPTRFTDPHAVDVWDASFRWRSGDLLRDRTIDATWQRVAGALAAGAGAHADRWRQRYIEVFSRWQLLPDERLLRHAGTGRAPTALPEPQACLNLGAFVLAPHSAAARFDHAGFAGVAGLSVRLLDDAVRLCEGERAAAPALSIGVMGLADALAALGLDYRGREAQLAAAAIARTLAFAALESALELGQERGPGANGVAGALAAYWRDRALPRELAGPLLQHRRYRRLTRISAQPCLALLANNASIGLAAQRARAGRNRLALSADAALAAQGALAAAMQPWIDAPVEIARGDCEDRLCSHCL